MPAEGELVEEGTATWANSAPLNTAQTFEVGTDGTEGDDYEVTIRNPSAVSDLSVSIQKRESAMGGSDRWPEVASFTVEKNKPDGEVNIVKDWEIASHPGRIVLRNATVLGVADGFTTQIRVRKI